MDSRDVMVEERITGVPISDIATFDRLGMDRKDLAEKGLTIFFTQCSAITSSMRICIRVMCLSKPLIQVIHALLHWTARLWASCRSKTK